MRAAPGNQVNVELSSPVRNPRFRDTSGARTITRRGLDGCIEWPFDEISKRIVMRRVEVILQANLS